MAPPKRFDRQQKSSSTRSFGEQSMNLNDVFQLNSPNDSPPAQNTSSGPVPPPPPSSAGTGNNSNRSTTMYNAPRGPTRVVRPNSRSRMSEYQKAVSARTLPTAPPPPTSAPTGLQKAQSVRAMSGVVTPVMPPPPPPRSKPTMAQRSASQRHFTSLGASTSDIRAAGNKSINMTSSGHVAPPPPPPPATTQPDDLLCAEGVPLTTAEGTAMADESQRDKEEKKKSKKDKKKKAKKEEIPKETFEDEMEDLSASEHDESLTAEEKAERDEKKTRSTFGFAILSALGLMSALKFISWIIGKLSSGGHQVPTGEDDAVNAAGHGTSAAATNHAAVNTAVVQQMGVAASQSAAASSAAGSAGAATAAAAAGAATVTAASSVTTVSVVTVTGVAAVGAYSSLYVTPQPCHSFLQELTVRPGHMVLHMQGMPENWFDLDSHRSTLESAFANTYNDVLGSCSNYVGNHTDGTMNATREGVFRDGLYHRYMENATLDGWRQFQIVDKKSGETIPYVQTEWTAFVGCDDTNGPGCSPVEPLFYDGDMPVGTNVSIARRLLEDSNVALFMDQFTHKLQDLMEAPDVEVYYGAALATNGTNNVMGEAGQAYNGGEYIMGQESTGVVDQPNGNLPVCTLPNGNRMEVDMKQGQVQIDLQGLDESFAKEKKEVLSKTFRSVFNDVMGACDGDFHRVLQFATLDKYEMHEVQNQKLLSTNWTATVTCAGCSDHEPLFFKERDNSTALAAKAGKRQLLIASDTLLAKFANEFAQKVAEVYSSNGKPPSAYYAATLDGAGSTVETVGEMIPFVVGTSATGQEPACASAAEPDNVDALPTGHFQVYISYLSQEINQGILANVMKDVYNQVSGMCDGQFQRVVHQLTIDNLNHGVKNDIMPFVNVNVTAKLACNECNDLEPMFWDGIEAQRRLQQADNLFQRFEAMLATEINLLKTDFKSTPYASQGTLFANTNVFSNSEDVRVFYGLVYDKNGNIKQTTGEEPKSAAPTLPPVGNNIILSVKACSSSLISSDKSRDYQLDDSEFYTFITSIFDQMYDASSFPKNIHSFSQLPQQVKDSFSTFEAGGLLPVGKPDGEQFTGDTLHRVESICYNVSHAVDKAMPGLTIVPQTSAPTTAPTKAITSAPTPTSVVKIFALWKFKLTSSGVRNATSEELSFFANATSDWMTTNMKDYYANDTTNYNFMYQDLSILGCNFLPDSGFNLNITTGSDFIFSGKQPTPKEVFDILDTFDLQKFVLDKLSVSSSGIPQQDVWIFDLVTTAALASTSV